MTSRLIVVGIASLVLAVYPGTSSAQSFGTRSQWTFVLRDALKFEVPDITYDAIRFAVCARGATISSDRDYSGTLPLTGVRVDSRILETSGEKGYGRLGLRGVKYSFDDGRLGALSLATNASVAAFKQRLGELSAQWPIEKRSDTGAFFRGPGMQVFLSLHPGDIMTEFYEGRMFRGSDGPLSSPPSTSCACGVFTASSPKGPCNRTNPPIFTGGEYRAGDDMVLVKTGVTASQNGGKSLGDGIAITVYANCQDPLVVQFVSMQILGADGKRKVGCRSTPWQQYNLTTNPNKPCWMTDSEGFPSPYYETSCSVNTKDKKHEIFDAPSLPDLADGERGIFTAKAYVFCGGNPVREISWSRTKTGKGKMEYRDITVTPVSALPPELARALRDQGFNLNALPISGTGH